jgi:ribonuclease HI
VKNWRCNGWKNSKKEPVANQDLWEKLIFFFMKAPGYDFIKVKGHAGNQYNEMVDKLAVAAKLKAMELA